MKKVNRIPMAKIPLTLKKAAQRRGLSFRQLRLLPDSALLEETSSMRLVLFSIAALGAVVLSFILWAMFTQVDERTITFGEVIPQGQSRLIQHLEGGLISQVMVKDGDEVTQHQPLVQMAPTNTTLELEKRQGQELSLLLAIERLRSYAKKDSPAFHKNAKALLAKHGYALNHPEEAQAMVKDEKALLDLQNATRRDKHSLLKTPQNDMFDVEQQALMDKIGSMTAQLIPLRHNIRKLQEKVNRLTVRSPISGVVKDVNVNVGKTLPPGGMLMEVVPMSNTLVVETKIPAKEIERVKVGEAVKVKVITYNLEKFGAIEGVLSSISTATFMDREQAPYYRGVVTLQKNYIGDNPEENKLLPGMMVQADIITGHKTLMASLLKPLG